MDVFGEQHDDLQQEERAEIHQQISALKQRIARVHNMFLANERKSRELCARYDVPLSTMHKQSLVLDVLHEAWRVDEHCARFLYACMREFFAESTHIVKRELLETGSIKCPPITLLKDVLTHRQDSQQQDSQQQDSQYQQISDHQGNAHQQSTDNFEHTAWCTNACKIELKQRDVNRDQDDVNKDQNDFVQDQHEINRDERENHGDSPQLCKVKAHEQSHKCKCLLLRDKCRGMLQECFNMCSSELFMMEYVGNVVGWGGGSCLRRAPVPLHTSLQDLMDNVDDANELWSTVHALLRHGLRKQQTVSA